MLRLAKSALSLFCPRNPTRPEAATLPRLDWGVCQSRKPFFPLFMISVYQHIRSAWFSSLIGSALLGSVAMSHAADVSTAQAAVAGSAGAQQASLSATTTPSAAPVAETSQRVVSVGGAATEIVYALGAGGQVVGVDQSSVFPLEARALPQVGYVRTVSAEGVLALEPQQIIAGHEIGPKNALAQIRASGLPVLVLSKVDTDEDLYKAINEVAQALGRQAEAEALIAQIREKFAQVRIPQNPPKVVFMMKPPGSMRLSAAGKGTRADDLIQLAGGNNVVTNFNGYKTLSQEALMTLQPDVIIVASAETFENQGTAEGIIAELKTQPAWSSLQALRNGHVYAVGLGEVLSFGPRMGDAVLNMNEIFRKAAGDQ